MLQCKSEQVVQAFIDRITEVEPYVNAFVQKRFDAALVEAKAIDRQVEQELALVHSSGTPSAFLTLPLLGLPFTGKDSISVKGMYLTAGLKSRKSMRATEDAECVANLKNAGAICIGLTNCPELAFWWDSDNTLFGRTNNPYDLSRIPGGSSGGQGACLGYGGSVIGTGGDVGGSIRMPSYFCGIFGHKPTPGIVGTHGHFPAMFKGRLKFLSLGPMCRFAEDLPLMFKVMAGDAAIRRNCPKLVSNEKIDFRKVKIYYMDGIDDPLMSPVDQEIRIAIRLVSTDPSL